MTPSRPRSRPRGGLRRNDEEALGGVLELARHFRTRLAGESDAQTPVLTPSGSVPHLGSKP